jgi:hypothetical protein
MSASMWLKDGSSCIVEQDAVQITPERSLYFIKEAGRSYRQRESCCTTYLSSRRQWLNCAR